MINAAIVGMGRWGQTLVDSIAGGSDALRFIAGTTRTHSKVEDYAADKGLRLYATLDELLSVEEIDAVVLATPHTVHFGQIMAAAAAGKHVYCEKPFCLTGAEATTALDALAAQGLKVAVGHNRRFFPNTIALKRIIETGALGEMVQIDGNFSDNLAAQANTWRANRQESPAGSMTSLGIHVIDMFIHLLGRIEYVQTISRRVAMPYDVDDTTVVLLRFSSGQLGCLGTVACTGRLWQVRAFGTAGWAEIVDHHRMIVQKTNRERRTEAWEAWDYPYLPSVAAALEAFALDCEGGAPFPVTPNQIRHGTAVLEAIVKSAATGQGVAVG